jgi:hypothetical protein
MFVLGCAVLYILLLQGFLDTAPCTPCIIFRITVQPNSTTFKTKKIKKSWTLQLKKGLHEIKFIGVGRY